MRRLAWTSERIAEARAEVEKLGDRGRAAKSLSVRWGWSVTREMVRSALRYAQERDIDNARTQECEPVQADVPWEPEAPVVHTSKTRSESYLVIPDLQIPFQHPRALDFCLEVAREHGVAEDNVLCAGDEIDSYFGSLYDHHPDAEHSPNSEIAAALDELKRWYSAFPLMRLANSNHGQRWAKKAAHAQIPSQLLRAYREILQAPEGWRWQDRWAIDGSRARFLLEHGHEGAQGIAAHRQKAIDNGISTVHGHLHSSAGIAHVVSGGQAVWGMNVGCLIDVNAYAFQYGRGSRFKPWLGCGVVLDGGRTPLLVPYGNR